MSSAELRENRTLGRSASGDGRRGTSDCADEVTLSRKGATSPTRARKLRSTGTKAKARVSNRPNSLSELKKQLEARTVSSPRCGGTFPRRYPVMPNGYKNNKDGGLAVTPRSVGTVALRNAERWPIASHLSRTIDAACARL